MKSISFRNCEVSTYEKSCTDENKFIFEKNQLEQCLSEWTSLDSFAFAYHDKDVNVDGSAKDKHVHIMLKFKNPVPLENIASKFSLPETQVERIKGRFADALLYLTHKNAPEKYQYPDSVVVANFDFVAERSKPNPKELIYSYGRCEISKKALFEKLTEKDFAEYYNLIKKMKEFRTMNIKDRNMEVIYICGSSGSGKTTLAKFLALTNGFDAFVSGSGKDVLDGYDKEECIILDDLRGDVFTKAELFKLLDNNTNSSVKSRYANKDISNCKLMIITSVKQPFELYDWGVDVDKNNQLCIGGKEDEPVKQFVRRLNYGYISIEGATLYSVDINESCKPVGSSLITDYSMNDVFRNMGIKLDSKRTLMNSKFFSNSVNYIKNF